ncbi:surface-adhesin E family protein [Acinetobacter sp. ANC 4641]|uniref:surface-adhesin E family protein n=1 Tax=Acinetobacter sp. ANC 4641 TaxID=2529847 RepID=UPI0010409B4B|nr:surface-adhesin E family protein [Acinetobacter sp. ANC 4641]TCB11466.1 hypothetical protein E0H78_07485 [Acinetobacter sp. ANC 4641]
MRKILPIFCLLLISATANADDDDWEMVATSDTVDFYLSPNRISNASPSFPESAKYTIAEAWVKNIHKTNSKTLKRGDFGMSLVRFSCPVRTYEVISENLYSKNKKLISSSNEYSTDIVIPNTTMEAAARVACDFISQQ